MPKTLQGHDDRLAIVLDPSMLNAMRGRIRLQEDVARSQIGRNRVAHASHVHDMRALDGGLHWLVCVPHKDQVGVVVAQKACEFGVAQAGLKPDAIVAARSGVDTENPCSIWQAGS